MSDLELRLSALRDEIAWPETPLLEPALDRRPARVSGWRPIALGLAILLAVLAGVLALSPGARSAFLEIFRIRGATVERVEKLPDVVVQRVDFGRRVSREEAERRVGFKLLDLGGRTGSTCETTAPRRSSTDRRRILASCSPSCVVACGRDLARKSDRAGHASST